MSSLEPIIITINGEDKSDDLRAFARGIGLDLAAPGRYSLLLVTHLFARNACGALNPFKVVEEIKALEGIGRTSGTKAEAVFNGPLLKGLWHKHYLPDGLAAMAKNLQNGIRKDGLPLFEARVAEALAAGEERYVTVEDCKAIVTDAVALNWQRRSAAAELTGEWIVFAQHRGENYYLTLAEHDTGDDIVRGQIDALCVKEFPFLSEILSPLI